MIKNGKSSKIVTGKSGGEMDEHTWREARADLRSKGDKVASDVHLHPLLYNNKGEIIESGAAVPSLTDLDPNYSRGYTQPSIILGFNEYQEQLSPGQIIGMSKKRYDKVIGFYNTKKTIQQINYLDFIKAIKKINQ